MRTYLLLRKVTWLSIIALLFFINQSCTNKMAATAFLSSSSESINGIGSEAFKASKILSPNGGYNDSIFINSTGDRIYFLNSIYSVLDFAQGTDLYPRATPLPGQHLGSGLDFNTDLYYVQWNGASWSAPTNLGDSINNLSNECCVWLSADETEIIFHRDNLDLPELGAKGNFIATRANRNASWGTPIILPGSYGSVDQSAARYRRDIFKTKSGDLYLYEHDDSYVNGARLLYGKKNGSGWDAPVAIPGTDTLVGVDETHPWVSRDELTLLFNRRIADGTTTLWKMTRTSPSAVWESLVQVPTTGFADTGSRTVWGDASFTEAGNFLIYIRLDTARDPWTADFMFAPGTPATGFSSPVRLTN